MKNLVSKIFLLLTAGLLILPSNGHAQSCNTLKEISGNSDYCNNNEISIRAKVYELLDPLEFQGTPYVYGFQITDDGQYITRVVSKDNMILVKGAEVVVNGRYYKNLDADGLHFDDTIVASGEDIKLIISAEELFNEILGPWGIAMNKEKALARRNIILEILIPPFFIGVLFLGLMLYRRRQNSGSIFEDYVESLFSKQEWRIAESNVFRKLSRWVESHSNPDFVFIHRRTNKKIAVEVKYKEKEYERILWAYEDQIEKYQSFSQKHNIPVFVILGIGGRPKNPKRVFLVPLSQIKYPDARIDYLEKFERDPKKIFSLDNHGQLI